MLSIEIMCLANSIKHGGRCVAGLRLDGQGWLRPVSNQPDGTLAYYHYRYADSSVVRTLDVVRIGLLKPRPAPYQPENWVIDGKPWTLVTRPLSIAHCSILKQAIESGPSLLHNELDRVPPGEVAVSARPHSLALIAPQQIEIRRHAQRQENPRARAVFALEHGGRSVNYDLSVTDLHWRDEATRLGKLVIRQSETPFVATVSLSETFEGQCYKLLAAIIPLPPGMTVQ